MKIDKNSYGSLALVYAICLIVVLLTIIFVQVKWVSFCVIAAMLWTCAWQTCFFRVPTRKRCGDSRQVSSVADGKVIIIKQAVESEYLQKECIQVSVYMNFFDVHANFWPVDGQVKHYCYYPGKHFLAFKHKASLENEHTCVSIMTPEGHEVVFKQIAGGFARRIVNYAGEVSEVRSGEQCGIIKFGSRIDIFLPLDTEIKVKLGDEVRACETILAVLPPV